MLERSELPLSLGSLLDLLGTTHRYQILAHWPQGEFHHDLLLHLSDPEPNFPGPVLVISSDCHGGVKELFCFAEVPSWGGLWQHRCPHSSEFQGDLPPMLAWIKTPLWFDPCSLLTPDAPSELKPEFRSRQSGGGWVVELRPQPPTP